MDDFKDLNELITVAKQINEGKYSLIDISVDPSSELFSIAQYFNDSITKLQTVTGAVEGGYNSLPVFESTIKSVIGDSKKASEDVLGYVDGINFNIDEVKDTMREISQAVDSGDFAKAAGLVERLHDSCAQGQEICFDIISSLEFKENSHKKIEKVLGALGEFEDKMAALAMSLGLKQQVITSENIDNFKEPKEVLQDQTLVNRLLQEFGL